MYAMAMEELINGQQGKLMQSLPVYATEISRIEIIN